MLEHSPAETIGMIQRLSFGDGAVSAAKRSAAGTAEVVEGLSKAIHVREGRSKRNT